MNRIILIGNGFDLAHGMSTSYSSFIEDFWKEQIEEVKQKSKTSRSFENEFIKIHFLPLNLTINNNFIELSKILEEMYASLYRSESNTPHKVLSNLLFKNKFLERITKFSQINNWVDIENEYYKELKKVHEDQHDGMHNDNISILNADFKLIKKLLASYLLKVENDFSKSEMQISLSKRNGIGSKIYSLLKMRDFTVKYFNQKIQNEYNRLMVYLNKAEKNEVNNYDLENYWKTFEELNDKDLMILNVLYRSNDRLESIKERLLSDYDYKYFDLIPNNVLFLNFNYTFTEKQYDFPSKFKYYEPLDKVKVDSIHIHGSIYEQDKNPIVFGFGDELDDDYKSIEKLNDNRYLENIKSINYLETDNYRKLLEYLNDEEFQVFIFGHSCGISDRTLLNTIFEHDNCESIKLYYHQKGDKEDNYSDIIRNISRNFNDKVKMRDKVVNKTYCERLS